MPSTENELHGNVSPVRANARRPRAPELTKRRPCEKRPRALAGTLSTRGCVRRNLAFDIDAFARRRRLPSPLSTSILLYFSSNLLYFIFFLIYRTKIRARPPLRHTQPTQPTSPLPRQGARHPLQVPRPRYISFEASEEKTRELARQAAFQVAQRN